MNVDTVRIVLTVVAGLAGAPAYWLAGAPGVFLYLVGIFLGSAITTFVIERGKRPTDAAR